MNLNVFTRFLFRAEDEEDKFANVKAVTFRELVGVAFLQSLQFSCSFATPSDGISY